MTRKLCSTLILGFYIFLCGFTVSLEKEPVEYYLNYLSKTSAVEVQSDSSYDIAFRASVNVLRDLNVNIIKKDYEERVIVGAYYSSGCFSAYSVNFKTSNGKTVIEIKGRGAWFSSDFIADRIQKEIVFISKHGF